MRRGAALVVVLLALALLFALGVPFLFLGRIRSEAARDGYDEVRARVAVESATAYAVHSEADSHPANDPTPLWDAAAEWNPARAGVLPEALGEDWNDGGQSWGLEVEAVQARVSLASAPLCLLQNLVAPCFISEDTDFRASELPATDTSGFPDQGLLWINGQVVSYGGRRDQAFQEVAPAKEPPEDLTATRFREGYTVIDLRVYNLALARMRDGRHQPPEFLGDLFQVDVTGAGLLPEAARARLRRLCTYRSGAFGAAEWQPAVWLAQPPDPDTPELVSITDGTGISRGTILRFLPESGPPLDSFALLKGGVALLLPGALPQDFEPYATRVYPLCREPVDLNSAPAEIVHALALGLRWGGPPPLHPQEGRGLSGSASSDWISPRKAREFAGRVLAARPLHGPDDLWERVLAPMVDGGVLSEIEAYAVHLNGLDPNDGRLDQSTLPYGYRSGDRYLQRVNAAVRSPTGATLSRHSARQEVQCAPGGPLLRLWRTQVEFEEAGRYGRGLHGVVTLPYNVGVLGGEHDFSDPLTLRTGLRAPPGRVQASTDEEESGLMPRPVRDFEDFGQLGTGRTEHFDFEASPLGYDARERGPWRTTVLEWNLLNLANPAPAPLPAGVASSAVEPIHVQGWFEMPPQLADATLFDLAGTELDRSRVVAAIVGGQLLVRGYDNAGDDPLDEDNQVQAVEVRVDPAEYPLADRWLHLSALLRGISPRGVQVAVDGVPRGRSNVLTYLTAPVSAFVAGSPDDEILVESTEGFPARGVLRIGDEVLEYSARNAGSFVTARSTGSNGYLGGRAAREPSDALINTLDTSHPAGAAVELYGYSAVLDSPIPPGGGRLSGEVGPWSMARAVEGQDDITFTLLTGETLSLGTGISCEYLGPVELQPAYAGDPYFAQAFQSDGGFAFLIQYAPTYQGQPMLSADGCRLGGVELVQYSARTGTSITLVQRSVLALGMQGAPETVYSARPASYVTEWADYVTLADGTPLNTLPEWGVFVIPISIKGTGVSDVAYLPGGDTFSAYVQLTHDGDDAATEWVRYDHIQSGCFLRDDWGAVFAAFNTFIQQQEVDVPDTPPGRGRGPGAGGPGDPPGARGPAQGEGASDVFVRTLGEPLSDRDASLEELRRNFDHRGVLHTYDHAHSAAVRLVPVFRTVREPSPWSGYVGRLDRVAVMQPDTSLPPFWFTVQWGAAPHPDADARVQQGVTYVAFREDPGLAVVAAASLPNLNDADTDVRAYARLVKFPSGERPLDLEQLVLGGDVSGGAAAFEGRLDEVSAHTLVGLGAPGYGAARGGFLLEDDIPDTSVAEIRVHANVMIKDGRVIYTPNAGDFLRLLAPSGLLDVDGERFGYYEVDPALGLLRLNDNSRGLHGTQERAHSAGTTVWIVDSRPAAALAGELTPGDAVLDLTPGALPFPPQSLLLVEQELLATFFQPGQDPNQRAMPRRRPREDDTDRLGDGILRGRFGTAAADHGVGALAYSFPARWHDRYVPESDDPAGAWLEIGLEEPNAHWRGVQFEAEVPDSSQTVRVLARAGTAAWEDLPGTAGLLLFDTGSSPGGGLLPLGLNSDRLDLRLSFDWGPGAFDPVGFRAHGWLSAPRLRRLLVDYLADARVNWQEEVLE